MEQKSLGQLGQATWHTLQWHIFLYEARNFQSSDVIAVSSLLFRQKKRCCYSSG